MTALAMIVGMLPMAIGTGRRRRAERTAGPRSDRRLGVGDGGHAVLRSGGVQCPAPSRRAAPPVRRGWDAGAAERLTRRSCGKPRWARRRSRPGGSTELGQALTSARHRAGDQGGGCTREYRKRTEGHRRVVPLTQEAGGARPPLQSRRGRRITRRTGAPRSQPFPALRSSLPSSPSPDSAGRHRAQDRSPGHRRHARHRLPSAPTAI